MNNEPELIQALNKARHELNTLHGLHAHDGHPEHEFQIDTSATLASIDAALEGQSLPASDDEYIDFAVDTNTVIDNVNAALKGIENKQTK